MLFQDLLARLVNAAHALAELSIVCILDVLHEKVDQPAFALHQRQEQEGLGRWLRRRRRRGGRGARAGEEPTRIQAHLSIRFRLLLLKKNKKQSNTTHSR